MDISLFLSNKYTNWYYKIVTNRRANPLLIGEYGEKHHIVPRSLGGLDDYQNLVRLSAKEHFICHVLLTKMTHGNSLYKMKTALIAMSNLQSRYHKRFNSNLFEKAKKGLVFSEEHKQKLSIAAIKQFSDPLQRQKASDSAKARPPTALSTKTKMKQSSKNRILTPELRQKFNTATENWTGRTHTAESLAKMKLSHAKRVEKQKLNPSPKIIVECPHCRKTGTSHLMTRYHFNNCKTKLLES
jgi:hypothetical protein